MPSTPVPPFHNHVPLEKGSMEWHNGHGKRPRIEEYSSQKPTRIKLDQGCFKKKQKGETVHNFGMENPVPTTTTLSHTS
eukprot:m.73527 g.73527  ORF g.73527 m.73527 type:complete len:79 (+) comp8423_c1_seq2:6237-6473(+)